MQGDENNSNLDILLVWPSVSNCFTIDAPSLGLAYLAAVLEPNYSVKVLECQTEKVYEPVAIIEYINKVNRGWLAFRCRHWVYPTPKQLLTSC